MKTWSPWKTTAAGEAEFLATIEQMLAVQRAKRAEYRNAYDTATRTKNDAQYDHDVERWNNGEGEV